jgi:hypothetical protein
MVTPRTDDVEVVVSAGAVDDDGRFRVHPQVVSALEIVAVRAGRTFLQSLIGFLLVGAIGAPFIDAPIFAGSFMAKLVASASLAVAPTAMSVLQNVLELLIKLDSSIPRLRG